ncbi:MAG TPA: hypothetical protein VF841_21225, partial [Anaeromyxobacter sp.]
MSKNGVSTGAWAQWTYDLPGGVGLLGSEKDSNSYERDYAYDSLQRPIRVTTLIPSVDTQSSGTLNLVTEYGYDTRYGRVKAVRYPTNMAGGTGELVALKYDGRGYQLGEVALNADYTEGTRYRQVTAMSERGQIVDQLLGRCIAEDAEYDPSTGVARLLTATRDLVSCPAGGPSTLVRQGEYRYDRFLNLSIQTKNVAGAQVEERYGYDELQRLTS